MCAKTGLATTLLSCAFGFTSAALGFASATLCNGLGLATGFTSAALGNLGRFALGATTGHSHRGGGSGSGYQSGSEGGLNAIGKFAHEVSPLEIFLGGTAA
tara:strand:- start:65 stop:367 length:303 start_codon:yes stop_codon:yes gene_type:complete